MNGWFKLHPASRCYFYFTLSRLLDTTEQVRRSTGLRFKGTHGLRAVKQQIRSSAHAPNVTVGEISVGRID